MAFACSVAEYDNPIEAAHNLHVRSTISGGDDVAGVRFEVLPLDCLDKAPTGPLVAELQPLEAGESPDAFADAFLTLPAGCYGVSATPVTRTLEPSRICLAACKTPVEVFADQTTELTIVNDCGKPNAGGVAAMITSLDPKPKVHEVLFKTTKFPACALSRADSPCGPLVATPIF
ncbi:MAG TPA: hypothetical protein VFH73_17755 [Polyangia bacterium]|nr:hypothetical protein [Polyangia bacterium]